ncbi:sterol-4-alpha-carboxylate 3-dehydrogenase, decarboxylating [Staphylotrichum tortipilum]|uniref:Sterol-4-alpha-carboxylate 3-dehydrogenase, decarboxylating n=1 Tax=Staphylotrichum tortipilum TaxID=2831512 RepID=A0AAN6MLZ4_9PEZI|nr:sterol-4-alpha-carboxylate 3-dehydrogenase, decarboxylating [Staphylotrichum longicolle]
MSWVIPAALTVAVVAVAWLVRINAAMHSVPEPARKASPRRWTVEELRETYNRVEKQPVDFGKLLPPRLGRRYVVVGGSGLVGGDIVLQLLQRGEDPASIRIVDFTPLGGRRDLAEQAAWCDFVAADIASRASVDAAFSKPWPASAAGKPLTVFHTAAAVRPQERSELLYHRISAVNRDGAANVLAAARAAGADVLVATSSASVGIVAPRFWIWPWESSPENYFQVATEKDFEEPLRPHNRFFANYARSKAEAERLICAASTPSLLTGTIRPGNPIYGQPSDPVIGTLLRTRANLTWIPHIVQNFVCSRNVALAHLQFEAALAKVRKGGEVPRCAGRTFNVTDPNGPISFADSYLAATALATTGVTVQKVVPLVLFLLAHVVEAWCLLLARLPFLTRWFGLREPAGPLHMLQPAVFGVSVHTVVDDSAARRSVEEGGIGYVGGCTTMEGVCEEILAWNREHKEE